MHCLQLKGPGRKAVTWHRREISLSLAGTGLILLLLSACAGVAIEPVRLHPSDAGTGQGTAEDVSVETTDLGLYRRDGAGLAAPPPENYSTPLLTERLRVGMLLPLSGPEGAIGNALLQAAEQALFDIGDPWIELVPRDTKGTPAGAEAAMQDILDLGVKVVLGPLLSTSVRASAPMARAQNINVISFSTDRSVAGGNVFLMGFSPESEVERIIEFARAQGIRRFAALVPETPYGDRVADALRQTTIANPRDLVRITSYPPRTDSIYDPVRELADYDERHRALLEMRRVVGALKGEEAEFLLKELEEKDTIGPVDFDAVLIAEGGSMLEALAPLLPFYDIDPKLVRFLGTGLWDDPGTLIEPSLEGGWFTGPHPLRGKDFFERFEIFFGYQPPRISSLGYDAMTLVAALQYANRPDLFSADALMEPRGFKGTDGAFRFTDEGTAERNLAIMEVGARSFRIIDEAPDIFEAPSIASARPPLNRLSTEGLQPEQRPEPAARRPRRRDSLGRWR